MATTKAKAPKAPEPVMSRPLLIPTIQIPQGDGSVLVKPGRPVEWLSPKTFGQYVGLSADSIYRKIGEPCLPEEFVRYNGPRKIQIRSDAVEHFTRYWEERRGSGA